MGNSDLVQILTTVDSRSRAEEIVKGIVGARLAACGQIVGPIRSTYWWKGKVENAEEWLIIFKTTSGGAREAALEIKRIHPYETPEIIIVGSEWADEDYLQWVSKTLKDRIRGQAGMRDHGQTP